MAKKILVIGSAVVDVHIYIDHLPSLEEDIHPFFQRMMMGGCAFNVAMTIDHCQEDYTLFSPIGTGIYGNYVKDHFIRNNIPILIESKEENGCCYCLIDKNGHRTFASLHGAEYRFDDAYFEKIHINDYDMVYVCGLEIEESTGIHIINFLKQSITTQKICYAPGPRIMHIDIEKNQEMMKLSHLIHLNKNEALSYLELIGYHLQDSKEACKKLHELYAATIVITDGANPVVYHDGSQINTIEVESVPQINGTGAGDGHIATIMALLHQGTSLEEAIQYANKVSAGIVQIDEPILPKEKMPKR